MKLRRSSRTRTCWSLPFESLVHCAALAMAGAAKRLTISLPLPSANGMGPTVYSNSTVDEPAHRRTVCVIQSAKTWRASQTTGPVEMKVVVAAAATGYAWLLVLFGRKMYAPEDWP